MCIRDSLGTEPEILFAFQRVVEAAAGKAVDGGVLVVLALQNTGTLKVVDRGGLPGAVVAGVDQLRPEMCIRDRCLHRRRQHHHQGCACPGAGHRPRPPDQSEMCIRDRM